MEEINFKNGIKDINKITMTTEEKKRVFDSILKSKSFSNDYLIKSPWSTSWFLGFNQKHLVFYLIIPLIIVLTSGGVVFASQDSLPDDPLYQVKVGVIEPIRGALIFSQEKKARYESSLAKERLVEAETLAVLGELDVVKEKRINSLLVKHSNSLNTALEKVNDKKLLKEADEIAINFKAEMNAHARVLETIDLENNDQKLFKNDNQISKLARSSADKIKVNLKKENLSKDYDTKKDEVKSMISKKNKKENVLMTGAIISPNNKESLKEENKQTINSTAEYFLDEALKKEEEGDRDGAYLQLLNSESSIREDKIFFEAKLKLNNLNKKKQN